MVGPEPPERGQPYVPAVRHAVGTRREILNRAPIEGEDLLLRGVDINLAQDTANIGHGVVGGVATSLLDQDGGEGRQAPVRELQKDGLQVGAEPASVFVAPTDGLSDLLIRNASSTRGLGGQKTGDL